MTRLIEAKDLYHLHSVTNPVLSPNGKEAIFVRTEMHERDNTYYGYLYHIDLETKEITQWTHLKERILNIKWSPDARFVSFLATRSKKNQLYILPTRGGEAQCLTNFMYGLTNYEWAPDGQSIWFSANVEEGKNFTDLPTKKDLKRPEVYEVTDMQYKLNGMGLLPKNRHSQIGVLDILTQRITRFTDDTHDYHFAALSHDGKNLVYSVNRNDSKDYDFSSPLYVVDIETKTETLITDMQGYFGEAYFSLDDRYIAFVGSALEPYKNATHAEVYIYDIVEAYYYSLTAAMDLPVGDYQTADVQQGAIAPGVVWCDDNALYFQMTSMGDTRLYYATLDGAIYPASPENEHVYGYDINRDAIHAIATISDPTHIGELYALNISTGEREQLTRFNTAFEQQVTIVAPEQFNVTADNGELVFGWLMKPANYEEGQTYPLVLNIHGGPHMMYGNTFIHEMQLLAAQGYGVVYVNPRGSHGYSQSFVNGCRNDYGGGDYRDLMAAVDEVIQENEWIDETRLGVTGGSYGGFMTNWIVSHTDRFKAAVTQRSISNWISFFGVSDIGYCFTEWQIGVDMTNPTTLWEHSPLKYADQVQTPLLILHSEQDDRCPIEQAEQLYVTLKSLGKETKFVRFPRANHDLSRTGLPNLRQARLSQITDWFVKYL
ncbi:S9 family peptidase [Kurthia massiliensis]|uniref:S9 family peptidase n=1 Tax=Kurthia massiliensis TaxID=1033739 RepID=UPI000289382A|nr:S9 family peptidase [Kurthia massiliensis]